jgi:hypothetical protein
MSSVCVNFRAVSPTPHGQREQGPLFPAREVYNDVGAEEYPAGCSAPTADEGDVMEKFRALSGRTRVDVVAAALFGFLTVLTLVVPDWIEVVFKVEPDGGNGSLEWLVVAGMALVAAAFAVDARRTWPAAQV